MIYSRWRPSGGYDYFATPETRALGTDLQTPRILGTHPIGTPSTELGRPVPAMAKPIGSGPLARGQVAPMQSSRGVGALSLAMSDYGLLVVAALFGWWLRGAIQKEWSV